MFVKLIFVFHLIMFCNFYNFYNFLSNRKWLIEVQNKIFDSLGPVFPVNSTVVLLDLPVHWNLGDSFIWIGERIFFEKRNITILAERFQNWDKAELLNIMQKYNNRMIALQGGGNYGDLYPLHQNTRFKAFADFPNFEKIIMPQSVYYSKYYRLRADHRNLERFSKITVFTRCQESLNILKRQARSNHIKYLLAPDMAFLIGDVEEVEQPTYDIVFISRTGEKKRELEKADLFKNQLNLKNISILLIDWYDWKHYLYANETVPNNEDPKVSEFRLELARRILSKGKIVMSDRMHAIILGLLMAKPVVALDNIYNKFGRVYDTFLRDYSDHELKLKQVKDYNGALEAIDNFLKS